MLRICEQISYNFKHNLIALSCRCRSSGWRIQPAVLYHRSGRLSHRRHRVTPPVYPSQGSPGNQHSPGQPEPGPEPSGEPAVPGDPGAVGRGPVSRGLPGGRLRSGVGPGPAGPGPGSGGLSPDPGAGPGIGRRPGRDLCPPGRSRAHRPGGVAGGDPGPGRIPGPHPGGGSGRAGISPSMPWQWT